MPSRIVCFVCGSLGGEYQLYSRHRDSGAYFPFLEHHDPPKGSRIPGSDGVVDSCHVCYAFLTQQWETYEQTNTPAIKRLYWLKRLDDGHFTGAEMKLQGEYMAQVMGLQYQPSCGDNCVPLSPDENSKVSRGDGFSAGGGRREKKQKQYGDNGGVLDLSVPLKQESVTRKSEKRSHLDNKEDKEQGSKSTRSKPSLDEYGFVCYTCGAEVQGVAAKVISSSRRAENEPFFPFLGKITPPKGAQPINSQGVCKVCEHCFSPLCHQWYSYENHGTPTSARIFKIKDSFFSNDSSIVVGSAKDAQAGGLEVCYLCSMSWPSTKMCPLFTVQFMAHEQCMYFPFVRELRRPQGARPLNPDGSVRVCMGCFGHLQIQWQRFEADKIPFLQRRYSLLPTSSPPSSIPSCVNPSESSATPSHSLDNYPKSVTQPLKIEISKSPIPKISQFQGGQPLPPSHPTASVPAASKLQPNVELVRQQSNEGKASTSNSIPHPLLQAGERPKKVCYVCGEKCLVSKAQILCAYPIKHEEKLMGGQQCSVPFFPFLANREATTGSERMSEEGTVITCSYCFYNLINQWREYEESRSDVDKNRWLRKYVTCEFVCFICGLTVLRKKIRTLEVQKFQFLRDHKAPQNALVMWGGEGVAACGSCHFSLNHQYSEYGRLGVPLEMRKYNWTVQNPQAGENSNDGQDSNHVLPSSGNEDSNLSVDDLGGGLPTGLQAGASSSLKPLSLSMLSPGSASATALGAGVKLPPKTAAVPPMNQMSPSNGLSTSSSGAAAASLNAVNPSTSSFAAALRKLAHQAQDPLEEAVPLKTSGSSPPSAHSPRATTPKRSHLHPMAFPAHTVPSSLPTPPVVTIAPTPAHHHHHHHHNQHHLLSNAGDSRQTSDRVSSAHSAPCLDQVSKPDRDQRPLSTHSRDDDRTSGKDNPLSRTLSRVHPQATATTTTASSSFGLPLTSQGLDLYARSFHPYHPDEEAALRQSLALSAYSMDPAAYAAAAAAASSAYHPAALLQQHPGFPSGGFRLDDPLILERYRLLQSPYFPFQAAVGGILPPHLATAGVGLGIHPMLAAAAATNPRYPAELLQQHYAAFLGSPNHPLMDPRLMAQAALLERSRMEEEKLRDEREKERSREMERGKEREREQKEKERITERELAYRVEREREREQQHRAASSEHQRNQEISERRDILTVPTRLPIGSERDRDHRDRSSHQQSHDHIDIYGKSSTALSHSDGLVNHSSRPGSRPRSRDLAIPCHPYCRDGSVSSHDPSRHYKHQASGKLPDGHCSNYEPFPASTHSSSHHHTYSHQDSNHRSSEATNNDNHFRNYQSQSHHQHHNHHVDQWAPSKVSSSHPLTHLISSHSKEKNRKSSEHSGLFRPFDEPSNKTKGTNNHHHGGMPSSLSSTSSSFQHHLSSHQKVASIPSAHEKNSKFSNSSFLRKDEKSNEVLSIPVLRVPPQSHIVSDLNSKSNQHPDLSTTTSITMVDKDWSSVISNNVQNRIERFDFKSLARECTSSTPPPPPPPQLQPPTSTSITQPPAISVPVHPYKSFYASAYPMQVLESTPFSLPALMESAFHEDLLQRQRRSLSKLDLEEKRMKELGRLTSESDGEMDEEDKMTARLTMIGRATPLPLETPEKKMKFLESVGLTTHFRKKELHVKKEMRRRRFQRLASVSPILYVGDEPVSDFMEDPSTRQLHDLLPNQGYDQMVEQCHEMDAEEKATFFKQLGMLPLSHAKKSGKCVKRKSNDAPRTNSKPETNLCLASSSSSSLPIVKSECLSSQVKKYQTSPCGISDHLNSPVISNPDHLHHSVSSQVTTISDTFKISSSSSSLSSMTTTTSAASVRPSPSSVHHLLPPVIFPPPPPHLDSASQDCVQQFHKAVLQESFNNHHKQPHLHPHAVVTDTQDRAKIDDHHHSSPSPKHHQSLVAGPSSTDVHTPSLHPSEALFKLPSHTHPTAQMLSQAALAGLCPWPGLTAMLESYQRRHAGGAALPNGDQRSNQQSGSDPFRNLQTVIQPHNIHTTSHHVAAHHEEERRSEEERGDNFRQGYSMVDRTNKHI